MKALLLLSSHFVVPRPNGSPGGVGQNDSRCAGETLRPVRKWPPIFSLFIPERYQKEYAALPNPGFPLEAKTKSQVNST